jgi:hypothetical protein
MFAGLGTYSLNANGAPQALPQLPNAFYVVLGETLQLGNYLWIVGYSYFFASLFLFIFSAF